MPDENDASKPVDAPALAPEDLAVLEARRDQGKQEAVEYLLGVSELLDQQEKTRAQIERLENAAVISGNQAERMEHAQRVTELEAELEALDVTRQLGPTGLSESDGTIDIDAIDAIVDDVAARAEQPDETD